MTLSINPTSVLTLEDFLKLAETKPASEYIDGIIYQKPMAEGKHSLIQTCLSSTINEVGKAQKLAYALIELRCNFDGKSIVPDISVFELHRIPLDANGKIANRFDIHPDWIIEILSPKQSPNQVFRKIIFSIRNGAKLGWLIDCDDESIMVFQPNQFPDIKEKQDILPVLDLGNWQLTVADVFSCLSLT